MGQTVSTDAWVLIVEDDVDGREALTNIVELLGWHAESCGTVADGREHLRAHAFDLVIVDIGLPDGSGADVARMAASMHPKPRTVALTGWSRETLRSEEVDVFDQILEKPVPLPSLRTLLQDVEAHRAA